MGTWEHRRDSVRIAAEIALKANNSGALFEPGVVVLPVEDWRRVNRMTDAIRRAASPERPATEVVKVKVAPPNLIRLRDERKTS